MDQTTISAIAVVCFVAGAAAVWFGLRRGPSDAAKARLLPATNVPFSESVEDVAAAVDATLRFGTSLRLLAIYAGRDGAESLDARWVAPGETGLPSRAPSTLMLQVSRAQMVDPAELEKGLRLGLPPAAPEVEASQLAEERKAEERRATDSFSENPFELDDEALTDTAVPRRPPSARPPAARSEPVDPEALLAARLAAVPWKGPFGWHGLIVARPGGPDVAPELSLVDLAAPEVGTRLAVHCEVAARAAAAEAPGPEAATPPAAPPAPAHDDHVPVAAPLSPAARLLNAERRMAEAIQTPRREADVVRAALSLLAEGLATDRCYAVEVEGLRTKPVEHERRSEAAASAVGLDFGQPFIQSVRARSGETIRAITLNAAEAAAFTPEAARARLGPVSRMMLPVIEKGRVTAVYIAEWIDQAKQVSEEGVGFAERVVARTAVARDRLRQYDAIAEQAAHARAAQEEVSEALEQIQAVVAALPDALVGLDEEGKITFVNRAAARLFRHSELELIGQWIAEAAAGLGGDAGVWERALAARSAERYSLDADGGPSVEITVVPDLPSGVCSRLVELTVRDGAVPSNGGGFADAAMREVAEPLGRLLGRVELIAGGSYGALSPSQVEALDGARRLGAELRAKLDDLIRNRR